MIEDIATKAIAIAENSPKVYQAGFDNAVSKYCPDFAESGTAVRCEPVEGYPLKVVSYLPESEIGYTEISFKHGGKNIYDPQEYMQHALTDGRVSLSEDIFTVNFTNGAVYINNSQANRLFTNPGTYTLRIVPESEAVGVCVFLYKTDGTRITYKNLTTASGVLSMTFTVAEKFAIAIGGTSGSFGTHSFRVQLEVGSVATEYEPFEKGLSALVSSRDSFSGGTFDWDTGKLTTTSGAVQNLPIVPIVGRAGVNTFIASTGTIEVSGKADPIAVINNFTNAVLYMDEM